MIADIREDVGKALLEEFPRVRMSRPAGEVELPCTFYTQITNEQVTIKHHRIAFIVSPACNTFAELMEAEAKVEKVMHDKLGFTRTNVTADDQTKVDVDLFMARMTYSALFDIGAYAVLRNTT